MCKKLGEDFTVYNTLKFSQIKKLIFMKIFEAQWVSQEIKASMKLFQVFNFNNFLFVTKKQLVIQKNPQNSL